MKTRNRISDIIIAIVFTALLLSCNSKKNDWDASGVFEATELIVSAEVEGRIKKLDIHEGDELQKGIEIGYIDTTQLYLQKMQLLASGQASRTRNVNIPRQIASLKEEIDKQKKEKQRYENLVKSNAANQKQVDDIVSAIVVLETNLTAQIDSYERSNKGVTEESSSIDIQVAQIEDRLKKARISSPIDGVVLAKYAEEGELAPTGRALFKVADISEIYLRAYITADQLTHCKMGDLLTIYSDLGIKDSKEYEGKITWISDQAEFTPKTIQTRDERSNLVYAIKVLVKNDGYIKRGMYGELKFR